MEQASNKQQWLSAHLYYAEPWEEFLIKTIRPFIEDCARQHLADQFFFIRYWLRGPHLRLRIKGERQTLNNELRPHLIAYFNNFFQKNPSYRKKPTWLKNTESDQQWLPNNSIHFVNYEPEISRYGGESAITSAELQFCSSSKATLSVIEENFGSWDYDSAMGYALQLHLSFAFAVGMTLHETSKYFSAVFEHWLPGAFGFFEKEINEKELENKKRNTHKAFAKKFDDQKSVLIPICKTIWKALHEGQNFEQEWLNTWIKEMKGVGHALNDLQNSGRLISPPSLYPHIYNASEYSKKNTDKWKIYDSYTHMTNNRLGILNRDEGYLAYLIKESTSSLLEGYKKE